MVKSELKERIKLIRTLKEAKDEADVIKESTSKLRWAVIDVAESIDKLITRVEKLDKEVEKEETKGE